MGYFCQDTIFVCHRGCGALELPGVVQLVLDEDIANNIEFVVSFFAENKNIKEVVLPHSISFFYEYALTSEAVNRISYLEEGTGTLCALKDCYFKRQRSRLRIFKSFVDRLIAIIYFYAKKNILYISTSFKKNHLFPVNRAEFFLVKDDPKFGTVYGLSCWPAGESYFPVAFGRVPYMPEKKIVFPISNIELGMNGYWDFVVLLSERLIEDGFSLYYKLHPGLNLEDVRSENPSSLRFFNKSVAVEIGDREFGFDLIAQGFCGAVSGLSSYQVYAHLMASLSGRTFPILVLESVLQGKTLESYLELLPDISLQTSYCNHQGDWFEALDKQIGYSGSRLIDV